MKVDSMNIALLGTVCMLTAVIGYATDYITPARAFAVIGSVLMISSVGFKIKENRNENKNNEVENDN